MSDMVQIESDQDASAKFVKARLESLQSDTEDNIFDLCDLLLDARENSYHLAFGFSKFNDWIELTPSFDLSARQATYYINIADRARTLEVDRSTMKAVKLTKLREIFSLDPSVHKQEMLDLLDEAPAMSFKEVQSRVQALKSGVGVEPMLHMTIKFPESFKEIFDMALEKARCEVGTYKDKYGEQVEAPNWKLLEAILAPYIAEPEEFNRDYVEPSGGYLVDMHDEEPIAA